MERAQITSDIQGARAVRWGGFKACGAPSGERESRSHASGLSLLCLALLSSHFQVKPAHSLHTTTDKLSRHAHTLPCLMGGGSYDAVDTIDWAVLHFGG
jgi:hypothetical protein